MAKDTRRNGSNHEEPLTNQPFKRVLKEFKPWGPSCLRCGENVDSRVGAAVANGMKGARRSQRQGWVHDKCLEPTGEEDKIVHSNALSSLNLGSVEIEKGKFMDMVQGRGVCMALPTYSESDMLAAIQAGEAQPSWD